MDRRFCAAAARTRLDRGPHRRDRVSLGGGTQRALHRDRGRVRPAQGGRHVTVGSRSRRRKAGDIGHPDRLRGGGGPGRQRPGRVPGAAGRQRHRPVDPATELAGKQLELLREVAPRLRRLAIIANVDYPAAVLEMGEVQAAARTLGLDVDMLEIRRAEDIAPAFETFKSGAQALYVCRRRARRLPTTLASTPWRSARDCRRFIRTATISKAEA